MAKLYFHYAAMNAGKSTMLLQASHNYRERGMETLLLTSALYTDASGGGRIVSRLGVAAPAETFAPGDDLFARAAQVGAETPLACVFADEAQFLEPAQVRQLARVVDRLGIPVMAYGLRTDFQGRLFPGSAELLAVADELREVRTICFCGRKATFTARLGADGRALREGAQVAVEKAIYVSLCRRHWEDAVNGAPPGAAPGAAPR
jgi:thymidine kinase